MILALMITEQCNFHCAHCMVNSSYQYSRVSEEVLEKWFKMLEIGKPDAVYIVGGEPFLHIDLVERIVERTKKTCSNIMIFTNGTFLLNEAKKKRIQDMGVIIRISDDRFHRAQWSKKLEDEIEKSRYIVIKKDYDENMIPVGRAYEEFKHLQYSLNCSLLTGCYNTTYKNGHRYMVMMDGKVNLYCATIEGELANVFEDDVITYELLVKREKILHNYLYDNVIKCKEDTYMAKMCNACQKYKVTDDYIYYDGVVVAETSMYIDRENCNELSGSNDIDTI